MAKIKTLLVEERLQVAHLTDVLKSLSTNALDAVKLSKSESWDSNLKSYLDEVSSQSISLSACLLRHSDVLCL